MTKYTDRTDLIRVAWAALTVAFITIWSVICQGSGTSQAAKNQPSAEENLEFATGLKSGDELFSIDPMIIVGIDYETATRKITLEPSKGQSKRYRLTSMDLRTRKMSRCRASVAWYSAAKEVAIIRAQRVFEPREAKEIWKRHEANAGILRIRDTVDVDAQEFKVILIDKSPKTVILRDHQYLFVPSISRLWFNGLVKGCGP